MGLKGCCAESPVRGNSLPVAPYGSVVWSLWREVGKIAWGPKSKTGQGRPSPRTEKKYLECLPL